MSCHPSQVRVPYSLEIITDTLFYTIVKVVLSGSIKEPSLLVDADSLIGARLQSALNQFGGGLPLLPDIQCIHSNVRKGNGSPDSQCDPCKGQQYKPPISCGPCGVNAGATGASCQNGLPSPEVYTQNDLVTFLPGQVNNGQSPQTNIDSAQSVPLLYGMTGSCATLSYALLSGDSLEDTLRVLNRQYSVGQQGKRGEWKQECGNQYRYYFNSLSTTTLIAQNTSLTIIDILPELNRLTIKGQTGTWQCEGGQQSNRLYYRFCVEGSTQTTVTLSREGTSLVELVSRLNQIILQNQSGQWQENSGCGYQFRFRMEATGLDVVFSEVETGLAQSGWQLLDLQNRVFTYTREISGREYKLQITPSQTQVNVVANQASFQLFLGETILPNAWQYQQSRVWEVTLTGAQIAQTESGHFRITGKESDIKAIATANVWEGWTVGERTNEILESVIVQIALTPFLTALQGSGWTITGTREGCNTAVRKDEAIQITTSPLGTQVFGTEQSLAVLAESLLTPQGIQSQPNQTTGHGGSVPPIQILTAPTSTPGSDRVPLQILGDSETLTLFYEEYPYLFMSPVSKNLQLLYIQSPYSEVLQILQNNWDFSVVSETASLAVLRRDPGLFLQVLSGNNTVTLWGSETAILAVQQGSHVGGKTVECIATGETATIFRLPGRTLHLSQGIEAYQIVAPKETVERICRNVANPKICVAETDLAYSSLTADVDTVTFLRALTQYDFGIGSAGWKADSGDANIYRYYTLESGGVEVASPYFIYIFTLPARDGSPLASFTKVEGLEYTLTNIIKPFLTAFRWNFISAGDAPVIDRPVPITLGKVVGLTGNIRKHPNCNAPPRIAITNINWSLNNDGRGSGGASGGGGDGHFVELIWETQEGNEACGGQGLDGCCITGDTAFIFSGQGSYGAGSLNAVQTSSILDGGGQPALPNNAFPNPTGNILFRTNGAVYGTFTIKFYKYSGYYNDINFFDNATNNLQAAIQANELIRRDWIRAVKQQREESILIPLLYNLERNNRSALRPSPMQSGLIVHTIVGVAEFTDPVLDTQTKGMNARPMELQFEFRNFLAQQLGISDSSPSIGLLRRDVVPPGDRIHYVIQYSIDAGTAQPRDAMAWLPYARSLEERILSLNTDFDKLRQEWPGLTDVDDFKVTAQLSAYVLDQTTNSYLKNDYLDFQYARLADAYLYNIILELDQQMRDPVRPGPTAVSTTSGAVQQIGGINAANQSRWLETQVQRLIRGSEAPVPLTLPTPEDPVYRFPDGSPVAGFWQNALATGVTVPLNPPPPLILPENGDLRDLLTPPEFNASSGPVGIRQPILDRQAQEREGTQQPQQPRQAQPTMFGNTSVRGRRANTIGGNSFVYR